MLVRLFRSTQFYPIALIVLFSVAIKLVFAFVHTPYSITGGTILFQNLTHWLSSVNPGWTNLIVFILLTSQALHLNYVLNYHEIFFRQSWLPALFYLIFSTQLPEFTHLSPLLLLNTIFIFVLDKIFSLYKNQKSMGATFDAALLIAIIALIYAPAVFLLPLYFIGVALLKPLSWRDLSIGIIGVAVPVLLVFVISFLNNNLVNFINHFKSCFSPALSINKFNAHQYALPLIIISLVLVMAILKLRSNYLKNITKSRLCQQILLLFIILGLIIIPFNAIDTTQNYMVLLIPVSSIIAYYFLDGKKIIYQELTLWLLIANWVYSNFFI